MAILIHWNWEGYLIFRQTQIQKCVVCVCVSLCVCLGKGERERERDKERERVLVPIYANALFLKNTQCGCERTGPTISG